MGQYRPEHRVGEIKGGRSRFEEIDRRPVSHEMEAAFEAAARAGLWRLDERRPYPLAVGG